MLGASSGNVRWCAGASAVSAVDPWAAPVADVRITGIALGGIGASNRESASTRGRAFYLSDVALQSACRTVRKVTAMIDAPWLTERPLCTLWKETALRQERRR